MIPIKLNKITEKDQITKSDIQKISNTVMETDTPLQQYIIVKAIETMVKNVLDNKLFRERVKENFLELSGGALNKTELCGVTVKTVSQEKKITFAKSYIYSDGIDKLESEIMSKEIELKAFKDMLKGKKLLEINNGTAQEIVSKEVAANVTDTFNLNITFQD